MQAKICITITNRDPHPITLRVEPWADEHEILPNKTFRIDFIAPTMRPIPVSYSRGCITVEGWEGSVAQIWCDGRLLN